MNRYQLRRKSYFQAAEFFGTLFAILAAGAYGSAKHGHPILAVTFAILAAPHLLLCLEMATAARFENRRDRATRNTYL